MIGIVAGFALLLLTVRWADYYVAPLFLNSRIERLGEKGLPKIRVERGSVYCRMKADDFRFPLPPDSRAFNPVISGGFDTVDGTVDARFDGTNHFSAVEYEAFLSGKMQLGGEISARPLPGGLLIKFHYFGDR